MTETTSTVVVVAHRQRIAAFMAYGNNPAVIWKAKYVKFGSGGHNEDSTPKTASDTATKLVKPILSKTITPYIDAFVSVSGKSSLCVTSICLINSMESSSTDLVGKIISEVGLFDENDNIICVKNFSPKVISAGEEYSFTIRMKY